MVPIREDHIDFFRYKLFELIHSYWIDISKQDRWWKYFWWKVDFRNHLTSALEKNGWKTYQNSIYFFIILMNNLWILIQRAMKIVNCMYIEKLMKTNKQLKKKIIKRQRRRHVKNFVFVSKPLRWWFFYFLFFIFLIFFNWGNNKNCIIIFLIY